MALFAKLVKHFVGAALVSAFAMISMTEAARADVQACVRLATVVNPSDVKLAASFVSHHGECVAYFDDPVFVAIAASLTGSIAGGAISPGLCTSILNSKNSPAGQALMSVAPVGVVSGYLDCGCAVASSGIADKIKKIISDMKSCAGTFDPSGAIFSGLDAAGSTAGFSTLWGLESNAPNKNAGVGNGGAPTSESFLLNTCPIGQTLAGKKFEAFGSYAPACFCPPPTQVFSGGVYQQQQGNVVTIGPGYSVGGLPNNGTTFVCAAPCPAGLFWENGTCKACPDLGSNGSSGPNASHTACIGGMTVAPCPQGKVRSTPGGACHQPCSGGQSWSEQNNACVSPTGFCDGGQIINGVCHHCQLGGPNGMGNDACNPTSQCPAGQQWNAATKICQSSGSGRVIMLPPVCPFGTKWNGKACVSNLVLPNQNR